MMYDSDQDDLLAQIVTRHDKSWTARLADCDHPIGRGHTEADAIRDLICQIEGVRR